MAIKPNFGSVSYPPWNDTTYIIGGGPSLRGFDFRRLAGKTVLAINDAALYVPTATALFSLDVTWIRQRWRSIQQFSGEVYLAVPEDFESPENFKAIFLRRLPLPGMSTILSAVHTGGGNSGYGALNLALLKGARRIVLMGYDMHSSQEHWHAGYAWGGVNRDAMYRKWAAMFDLLAGPLKQNGISVVNASATSRIQLFPKVDLAEVPDGLELQWQSIQ